MRRVIVLTGDPHQSPSRSPSAGPVSVGPVPLPTRRREESELLEGEVAVFDEGGGVLVHPHGDQRVGVAEPLGDGRDGHVLGEKPDGVGVAQVADTQTAVIWPGLIESGGHDGALPGAGEAAGREWLVGSATTGVGEDVRASAAVEPLAVGEQDFDGLLVEGDGAMNDQPAGFLFFRSGFPSGRTDGWSSELEATRPGDGAVIQGEVGSEVLPTQRDQL